MVHSCRPKEAIALGAPYAPTKLRLVAPNRRFGERGFSKTPLGKEGRSLNRCILPSCHLGTYVPFQAFYHSLQIVALAKIAT
ncbi:hypothetical protein [Brasilonema bromeliae]|uniref:hypothetical protein n=1 Tax=Brasilonema bromeliae TaxID=383615 RepID=UPI00145F4E1B|nr:hypothetical protein [Brasilonema bromeliae]